MKPSRTSGAHKIAMGLATIEEMEPVDPNIDLCRRDESYSLR